MVELMLVVGIMIILAAVSLPALFGSIRNYEIRAAATEVAGEIQRARATAVMKNVRYGVILVVRSDKQYQYVIEDLQNAADKAAATSAASFFAGPDTADRVQLGPRRVLPGRVTFSTACPGFAANNTSLRFTRLGTMCEPSGTATPRLPGTCPVVGAGVQRVQFAGGDATFCLRDTRGPARAVTVTAGGRVQIAVVTGS